MKNLIFVITFIFGLLAQAGVDGGGGGGPRPSRDSFMVTPIASDLVQTLSNDGNIIRFKYKAFDLHHTEIHDININDISSDYLDAIKKSEKTGNWEPVSIVH